MNKAAVHSWLECYLYDLEQDGFIDVDFFDWEEQKYAFNQLLQNKIIKFSYIDGETKRYIFCMNNEL